MYQVLKFFYAATCPRAERIIMHIIVVPALREVNIAGECYALGEDLVNKSPERVRYHPS